MKKPLDYFNPRQQVALQEAIKGRYSPPVIHALSTVQLFELARTSEYRKALGKTDPTPCAA
ncbi:MAG: hypothetical protein Q7R94_01725 [bacterium]|nr:hypothetical protein [bacterium]